MTTDGGEHWSAVAYLGGAMRSLEVIDHQVLAVTACHGPNGLTGGTLSCRTRGGGPWIRITALADNSGAGGIATRAGMAAVVDGSSVLVICDGGLTLTKRTTPCRAVGSPFPVVTSVAAEAPHGLALLCTGQGYTGHTDKTVYVSGDRRPGPLPRCSHEGSVHICRDQRGGAAMSAGGGDWPGPSWRRR